MSHRHSVVVTTDDAFTYALRTAYLHYLLQPRPRRQIPAPAPAPISHRSSTDLSVRDLIADFSRAHTNPKSARFPKEFLPILQRRLESVWMGRDSRIEFQDAAVKRTFAAFYTQFKEPRFYDAAAKNRRPEDLLLIFYSSATKELQKVYAENEGWKVFVDRHVALFVRLMGTIIKDNGWNSSHPELVTRLATLEKKLLRHDENLAEETTRGGSGPRMVQGPPEPLSYNVNDMAMVKVVARVFGVSLEQCQEEINRNKSIWTERAALQDMKAYQANLNLDTRRTLRMGDFDNEEAYEKWKKAETQELSKLMLNIIQSNPDELRSTNTAATPARPPGPPRHSRTMSVYPSPHAGDRSSVYSIASTIRPVADTEDTDGGLAMANGSSVEDDDTPYVYIPPDPRTYYRHVVEKCITHDLDDANLQPINFPEEADCPPLYLLSKESLDLLNQCGTRWRLPQFSRMVLLLDCVGSKYKDKEVDNGTVDGAFVYFKLEVGCDHHFWTRHDIYTFQTVLYGLHDNLLDELSEKLWHAFDQKAVPIGDVMWVLDSHIYSEELFEAPDMQSRTQNLRTLLMKRAEAVPDEILQDLPSDLEALTVAVVQNTQKFIKLAEKIMKRYKQPVLGEIEPGMIFILKAFPRFARLMYGEIEKLKLRYEQEMRESVPVEDAFGLYDELKEIRRIYEDAFPNAGKEHLREGEECSEKDGRKAPKFPVHFENLFADAVERWLHITDKNVLEWVESAIRQDDFTIKIREVEGREPTDEERHTSSVKDIFRMFNSAVDTLQKLEWGDEVQYARFSTVLAKILGKGVARYCEILEDMFRHEMDKPTPEQEMAANRSKQQKWMAMAKEAWSSKEKVEPFQFSPESCVKLNNIEFAIQKFDKLEQKMGTDKVAATLAEHTTPDPRRHRTSYVFTIKIIEAEDLIAGDVSGYSDPYVVLGDEYQKRLGKTRIVYSSLNPRWEETFDINTTGPIFITATIWDWDNVGKHDLLGRTTLKLDPVNFMDFLSKEFWLDLDPQGRLLLRVSMEGERDDIQFYFGKAFRVLTRTQRDMIRQITDKLSAYIHHCLSRQTLKSISAKPFFSNFLNRNSVGNGRPQSTIINVNSALTPLTDYFNDNFAILNTTLTSTAMHLVMAKLWKEVLTTLELLLAPTLSDKPSQQKQLTRAETDIVFTWLQTLFDFFCAPDEQTGETTGVPVDVLKTPKYHDLQTLNYFYHDSTEALIRLSEKMASEAAARQRTDKPVVHSSSLAVPGAGAMGRAKSVVNKRNLGTMRKQKEEKRRVAQEEPNDDIILRILRMRPEPAAMKHLRDRTRQKERLEAARVAQGIVAQSKVAGGVGRMMGRR